MFVFPVDMGFCLFEGRTDALLHFIKEGGLEGEPQTFVIKMFYVTPETVIRETAFGDEAVDVGIPFQGASESMEDADKTGDEVFGFVHFVEHAEDDAPYGMKEAVQEGEVFEEKMAEIFVNGKDTMSVCTADQFEGHGVGALLAVFYTAGRAETALASERDELHLATVRAGIHRAAEGGITTVDHPVNVFDDGWAGM